MLKKRDTSEADSASISRQTST